MPSPDVKPRAASAAVRTLLRSASAAFIFALTALIPGRAAAQSRLYAIDGSTLTLTGDTNSNQATTIADGSGGAFYMWQDLSGGYSGNDALYVIHLSSTGALAAGWPAANSGKVLVTSNTSSNNGVTGAYDGAGGVVILWPGGVSANDVYATRVTNLGGISWSVPATPGGTSGGSNRTFGASQPFVIGSVVMFLHASSPSGVTGGYVQGLNLATGANAAGFTGNSDYGVSIGSFSSVQTGGSSLPHYDLPVDGYQITTSGPSGGGNSQQIIPDGSGGFYDVWQDTQAENGGANSLYIVHLSSTGSLASGWPTTNGGAVLATKNFESGNGGYSAITDGAGGAIILWSDATSGPDDVLGQRFDASGTAQWNGGSPLTIYSHATYQGGIAFPTYVDSTHVLFGQEIGTTNPPSLNVLSFNPLTGALSGFNSGAGVVVSTVSASAAQHHLAFAATFSPAGGGQSNPGVIVGLSTLFSSTATYSDIYAFRIDTSLSVKWAQQVSITTGDKGQKGSGSSNNGDALAADQDGSGGAYFVWASSQNGSPGSQLYAADLTVGGAFASGYASGGTLIADNQTQAGQLSVAGGGSSGYVAVWTNNVSQGANNFNPVYAQVVGPSAATKLGGNGYQVGTGQSSGSGSNGPGSGSAAALSAGTAAAQFYVSWSSNTSGSSPNPIITQGFDASGNPLFNGGGLTAIQDLGSRSSYDGVTTAVGGNLAVAWSEGNAQPFDYVQLISTYAPPTGTQSVQGAISVSPSATASNPGVIVALGSNFNPNSPNATIIATKVTNAGSPLWETTVTNNVIDSALDNGLQNAIAMDVDGSSGAYIAWVSSQTTPGGEIYATDLAASNGALQAGWTANGKRVAYANNATNMSIIGGAGNGFLAAWTNNSNGVGGNPVVAQIVTSASATKFPVGTGTTPSTIGGHVVGVGQTSSGNTENGSAAVTNPGAANQDYYVFWSSNTFGSGGGPIDSQAFDVNANALFGAGFTPVYHVSGNNSGNISAVGAGANVALGWGDNQNCGGGGCDYNFAQMITTQTFGASVVTGTVVNASSVSVTATWVAAPAFSTGYELDVSSIDPSFAIGLSSASTSNPNATTLAISGLQLNSTYYVRIGNLSAQEPPNNTANFIATTLAAPLVGSTLYQVGPNLLSVSFDGVSFGQANGYRLDASTAADFSGNLISSSTYSIFQTTLAVSAGLTANDTYFLRVGALNSDGVGSADYTVIGATDTLVKSPVPNDFVGVSSVSMTVDWFNGGNSTSTAFQVGLSSAGFGVGNFGYETLVVGTSATFSGLIPNTSYYASVAAVEYDGAVTSPVFVSTVATSAAPPAPAYISQESTSTVVLTWSTNSNPAGTEYLAQLSTNPAYAPVQSTFTTTTASTAAFTGLSSNATFYARVEAFNVAGAATAFQAAPSTWTDAAAPFSQQPDQISTNSITANWAGGFNVAGTGFLAQISTDNFLTLNSVLTIVNSTATSNFSATFNGLAANTTYFFQVAAIGNGGELSPFTTLPSTMTALQPPAAAPLTGVTASGSTANWTANGNGPTTIYVAQVSTGVFPNGFAGNQSSTTQNLDAVFTGLNPNTTYYFGVQSTNGSNNSNFVSLGSTITPAAAPSAASPLFTNVGNGALTVNWNTNGNSSSTTYKVQIATTAGFAPVTVATVTASSATFTGLAANTTYFAEVAPFGSATGSFGSFVVLGSTATQTAPPTAALFTGVTASSLTANWLANGNPAGTVYLVFLATDPAFGTITSSDTTTSVSQGFTNLLPNTTYYGEAAAFSVQTGTYTSFTVLGSTTGSAGVSTLANAPTGAAVTATDLTDVTLGWNANGDPAGTVYTTQLSTNNFATTLASSTGAATANSFSGLASNTTYFLRVDAQNNSGTATAFTAAVSSATSAAAPASANPSGVTTSSITANWGANGNSAGTQYVVEIGTDPVFGSFNSLIKTTSTAATFVGLAANTNYDFQVQALGFGGAVTAFTSLPSTSTLLLGPAAAATPIAPVTTQNVTVGWASGGNGAGTTYNAQISSDNFADVYFTSATENLSATFGAAGAGPALVPNTTYFFRVQATTTTNSSAFLTIGSTATPVLAATAASPLFTAVSSETFAVDWNQNGNSTATVYSVQIATSNAFSPVTSSALTTNASAAFAGLAQNTTYFARVAPFSDLNKSFATFATLGSSATVAPAPSASAFTGATTGALTANWGADGNPAGTVYLVFLSTDPTFATITSSNATTSVSQTFAGLSPNTTYFAEAAAFGVDAGTYTAFTQLLPTAGAFTLANAPTGAAVTLVGLTGETLTWGANGDPAGTGYTALISTNNFTTINASNVGTATSALFSGLASNTTYFLKVQAANVSGATTTFSVAAASSTNVAAPLTANPTNVTTVTVTANWLADGDSPTTQYIVQIGTDPVFGSFNASSKTANTAATFSGLGSNTAYFFQVEALGNDGTTTAFTSLPSTSTLLLGPTAAATPIAPVTTQNVTVNWASGGNGAGTTYNAQISSDNFADVYFTSATENLNATFGAAGAGPALVPNTTYFFRVQATTTTNSSAFLTIGSTATPTVAPTAAATLFTGVGLTGLTVNWNTNGASTATVYGVRISTVPGFVPTASSTTVAGASAAFAGLASNTTYYAQVRPFSDLNKSFDAFTTLGSSATVAPAPSASAFTGATTGALTANWGANGNPAGTVYLVFLSTDPTFATITSSNATTSVSQTFAGLSPNTTYFAEAAAFNVDAGTYTAFTQLLPTTGAFTLAAPPTGAAVTLVGLTGETLTWSANGDPAGTGYTALISTNNFTTINASNVGTATSALFSGLASNTTYFLKVQAANVSGATTTFSVAAASSTNVAAPLTANPTNVTTVTVTANWLANGDSPTTQYVVQIGTDPVFGAFNASSKTANTAATFSGLGSNTAYFFQVEALGNDGTTTAFTSLPSTSTLLLGPSAAAAPISPVTSQNVTVNWASGGNGAGTTYNAQISTDNFGTVNFTSATLNLNAAFGAAGAGPALVPNTTYFFRVQAATATNASAFLTIGSTATPVAAPTAAATPFTAVAGTNLTVNWNTNGNSATTVYKVQISTLGSFAVQTTSLTQNANATFAGLIQNATYFAQIAPFSTLNEGFTAFAALGSTATPASVPAAAAYTAVTTNSVTANWTSAANALGTSYQVQLATDPAFGTLTNTISTTALTATFAGLTTNTTYYGRVEAYSLNADSYTAFAALGSTSTLTNPPTGAAVTAVGTGLVTFTWNANSNPAGTVFDSQISTNNFATIAGSNVTTGTIASYTGLPANTTFFARVNAFSGSGAPSTFSVAATTSTNVAAPLSAAPSGVTAAAVVANWSANGNSPTTVYTAEVSSNAFASVLASSVTRNASATFSGLTANSSYAFKVLAAGNDGTTTAFTTLPSTTTLLLPPAVATTTYASVTSSSALVAWATGGNGAGTTYVAVLSTGALPNAFAGNVTSTTFNTSALFGLGGVGAALAPNSTYFFAVQTATTTNASAFVSLASTVTVADAPLGTMLVAVASTTVDVSWSVNGNPNPGTTFELWQDVTAGFTSPTKTLVSTFSYLAQGLTASTTYFYKVRVLDNGGTYTGFDTAVTTRTLAPAPGLPGTPAGTAVGASSITWTWTAAQFATSYNAYRASTLASLGSTSALTASDTGLSTNTAYGFFVGGVDATGAGPLSAAATVYTLAAPPAGTAVAGGSVQITSATLNWTLNTNPAGTDAQVQRSTDGVSYAAVISSATGLTYTDFSLLGCSTYYYQVRNANGDGIFTGFDGAVSLVTLPTIPASASNLTAQAASGDRIALSWTQSPTEGITGYDVFYDSGLGGGVNGLLGVVPSSVTSFTSGVLTSSAAYTFAVRALHRCNTVDPTGVFATAAATAAVAAVRADVLFPGSGHHVNGNFVTVYGGAVAGQQSQVASVRFQFAAHGSGAWTDIPTPVADVNHPNPATAAPFVIHWDVTATGSNLTSGSSYDLRAIAVSVAGSTDTAPDVVTIVADQTSPDINANINGGVITSTIVFNTAVANTVISGGSSIDSPTVLVVIPGGAVSGSTAAVTVNPAPTLPVNTPPSGYSVIAGLALTVNLGNGQSQLLGGETAAVTFNYPSNQTVVNPQIWVLNPLTGTYSQDFSTTFDPTNHKITGNTPHFSFFVVLSGTLGTVGADLSGVRVYPNPYRPNSGNPDLGGGATGITIDTLPTSASIKIYTVTGELVASFDGSSPTGTFKWDARNGAGRDVATGLYIAVIKSPGVKTVTKKILVVR